MSKLMKWLNNYSVDFFINYMKNNKKEVNIIINKKLDIPMLSEKQESGLIEIFQDVMIEVAEGMRK